jgi:hypothetical protein
MLFGESRTASAYETARDGPARVRGEAGVGAFLAAKALEFLNSSMGVAKWQDLAPASAVIN